MNYSYLKATMYQFLNKLYHFKKDNLYRYRNCLVEKVKSIFLKPSLQFQPNFHDQLFYSFYYNTYILKHSL